MYEYWLSNGSDKDSRGLPDHWGNRDDVWVEAKAHKGGKFGKWRGDGYLVTQPCNYASNIAYYHSVLKICKYKNWQYDSLNSGYVKSLKRAYALLGAGSAMFHGSQTNVGSRFDNDLIALISYLGHQMLT